MSNFKNRIITLSGEPASGKSTVIKKLTKDYEEKGYKVHVFSIGDEFRKLAEEKGLTIDQLNEYIAKNGGDVDKIIDSRVAKSGEVINSKERPKEVYIFDSRLAFHNIPTSFSVRLTVDENVAGKRVFEDTKRGKEDKYKTVEDATKATKNRKENEIKRYKDVYGIDLQDKNNYNLVIETSYSTIEDIAQVIEQCVELDLQGKYYGKLWTSPKKILPIQSANSTLGRGFYYTLEELRNKMKNEGYNPGEEIEVLEGCGTLYILQGHHRNFAAGSLGKTLVPYTIVRENNSSIISLSKNGKDLTLGDAKRLREHEEFFDKFDENGNVIEYFSYSQIFPDIYNPIREIDDSEK